METQVQLTQNCSTVRRWWKGLCNFSPCTANESEVETVILSRPNIPTEKPCSSITEEESSETKLSYMVGESGTEYLTMGIGIGKGAFSKVILAKRVRDGHLLAAKSSIPERPVSYRQLVNEYEILSQLDHPNIIKPLDFINYTQGISIIIFKNYTAGTLAQRLKMNGHLPEAEVKLYTYQLCSALAYLHKRRIFHSDIKPSNIICKYTRSCEHGPDTSCSDSQCNLTKYKIMLIDFGMAIMVPKGPGGYFPRAAGTGLYMAPEVFSTDQMVFKADMWSVGVTVYQLLSGAMPYDDPSIHTIANTVSGKEAYLHTEEMAGVSYMGKHFIKKCLDINIDARLSSHDALRHPWISPKLKNAERISFSAVFKMMQLFCRQNYLRCDKCYQPCVSKDDMQDLRALAEVYKTRDEANAMVAKYIPYPVRRGKDKASEPDPQNILFSPLLVQARYRRNLPTGINIDQHEDRRYKNVDILPVPHMSPTRWVLPKASPARWVLPQASPARRVLPQVSPARRMLPQVPPARRGLHHFSPARCVLHGRAIDTPPEQVHSRPRLTEYDDCETVPGFSLRAQRPRRMLPPTPPWSPKQLPGLPITPDSEYI